MMMPSRRIRWGMASLAPREHGAYGQIVFPFVTALAVNGVSAGGLLTGAALAAGFLAHEPAAVLRGLRGARAKAECGATAARWLAIWLGVAASAASAALLVMPPDARWSLAIPIIPAMAVIHAILAGREKSAPGEIAVALSFSTAAIPVSLAAGAPLARGAMVTLPFAALFIAGTLAVRLVIVRVRGGGSPHAARAARQTAFVACTTIALTLGALTAANQLPTALIAAAAPGLLTAIAIVVSPIQPCRLRAVGWTLIAASVATAAIVVATTG
jgi:hypothetical protein